MKKILLLIALIGFLNSKAQQLFTGSSDLIAIHTGFSSDNPADASSYVFGSLFQSGSAATTASRRAMKFPYNVTCVGVSVGVLVAGTLGTTEAATINLVVGSSTTAVLAGTQFNAIEQNYSASNLSISVPAGTTWEGNYITPTFVTNPTTVSMSVIYYFRRD
jgi:hypothetical protein